MHTTGSLFLGVLLDASLDGLGVCAHNLTNLLATLEEDECGHSADTEFLGDVGDFIDVQLVKAGLWVLLREPLAHISLSDSLAGQR
jgi:hypothetical protein